MSFDEEDKHFENPWKVTNSEKESEASSKDDSKKYTEQPETEESSAYFIDKFDKFISYLSEAVSPKNEQKKPKNSSYGNPYVFIVIGLSIVSLWVGSGLFRVQESEIAVVLRFGKVSRLALPGLNYRLPYPFESEITRKVSVYNKIDGGARDLKDAQSQDHTVADDRTLMLTGDENMIHINYTVLWKIKDLIAFLFTTRNAEQTIVVAAESVLREVLGQTTARLALTDGREAIGSQAQELLQKLLDHYGMGVNVISFQLQRVEAPSEVVQAFNDMQASLTDADRARNEAEAYKNDILPRARGESEKILQGSHAYAQQIIASAEGEVESFALLWSAYQKNPKVVRQKIYLETAKKVLSNSRVTITDKAFSRSMLPFFNMNSQPTTVLDLKKSG